jgi:hypothetical protein
MKMKDFQDKPKKCFMAVSKEAISLSDKTPNLFFRRLLSVICGGTKI